MSWVQLNLSPIMSIDFTYHCQCGQHGMFVAALPVSCTRGPGLNKINPAVMLPLCTIWQTSACWKLAAGGHDNVSQSVGVKLAVVVSSKYSLQSISGRGELVYSVVNSNHCKVFHGLVSAVWIHILLHLFLWNVRGSPCPTSWSPTRSNGIKN